MRQTVGFQGDLPAFFAYLRSDPKFYYTRGADLVAGYVDVKKRIDAALPRLFSVLPKADYEVREVEAFRAKSAAGAFYQQASADGSRPGIFYVNTYDLKSQPRFGMETLSLHEASPGHHFQISIQQELTGLPRFRRFGGDYTAYVEGWALYAEYLGPELGLFTDPYQAFGRLNDEQLRAMRLVVDTGLHAKGWTREQAIEYMIANSTLAPSDVESEVERYIAWPGQALGYKVGDLRIQALRHKAEASLGREIRHPGLPSRGPERRRRADGDPRAQDRPLDRSATLRDMRGRSTTSAARRVARTCRGRMRRRGADGSDPAATAADASPMPSAWPPWSTPGTSAGSSSIRSRRASRAITATTRSSATT